jgi:hypothetical protein
MKFDPKQIGRLEGTLKRAATAATLLTGTGVYTVTASMGGSPSGGSDSAAGVFTTSPLNRAVLVRRDNGRAVERADGTRIFGRITFAATVFSLTLYVSDGAGGETAYVPVAGDGLNNVAIDMIYGECVKWEARLPTQVVNALDGLDDVSIDPNSHVGQIDPFLAPTAGQTAFPLSQTPKAGSVMMFINGQLQKPGTDFTVAGATLTYLAVDYAIAVTDAVHIAYDR